MARYNNRQAATLYAGILALPDGPDKDARLKQALDLRMTRAYRYAQILGPYATLLNVFSHVEGIPIRLARRVVSELSRHPNARSLVRPTAGPTYSPREAVEMVARAFDEFDPRCGAILRQSFAEGRISFLPTPYLPHADGGKGKRPYMPDDIKALPPHLRCKPYASLPLDGHPPVLTAEDRFILAHEAGHHIANQLHYDAAHSGACSWQPLENMCLHETFAVTGERFLYRYLMRASSLDTKTQLSISTAYESRLQSRLLNMAWAAKGERAIADAYWHSLGRDDSKLPTPKELQNLLAYMDRSAAALKTHSMIAGKPFYYVTYPLATAGSLGIITAWENSSAGDAVADRWLNIAAEGNSMDFTSAMSRMGVDTHSPSFISDAINDFISHQRQTMDLEKLMAQERKRERKNFHTPYKPYSFTLDLHGLDDQPPSSPPPLDPFAQDPAQKARKLIRLNVKIPGGPLTREAREKLAAIVDDAPRAPKSLRSLMRTRDRSDDDSPSR